MAAKRLLNDFGSDPDQPTEKRIRTRPFFTSVIGEVLMGNSFQNICTALEPMLRRVVNEEVERGIRSSCTFTRSPSLRIQALEASNLQLIFTKRLLLPIFTGTKIGYAENSPLQLHIVETSGDQMVPTTLPYSIKVEIVVLDGDFPQGDCNTWSSKEFEDNIVRERTGKRPLLAGDVIVTMRDGLAMIGDIEFTDNSSWIRSRKFRLGARVVPGSRHDVSIREAITEAFAVKDHRGELYKKHHPPMLNDEVWRLEKIGKDGAFHKKLASENINTVQDFLKLSIVDPQKLRTILGPGMSEKMWEVVIKHARNCDLGKNLYILRGYNFTVTLNAICQIVMMDINGQIYARQELSNLDRTYVEKFVIQAYSNWNSLEEVDGSLNETALLTRGELGEQHPNLQETMARAPLQPHGYYLTDKSSMEVGNADVGSSNWQMNAAYQGTPVDTGVRYYLTESSSGCNITPPSRTFNGS